MPSSLGRVLVVEDEPRVAATLRDILVELGYIVKLAQVGVFYVRWVRRRLRVVLVHEERIGHGGESPTARGRVLGETDASRH
jgi:DNA-binding NtrC family response regulator